MLDRHSNEQMQSPLSPLFRGLGGVLVLAALTLLSACGGKSGRFRMEGRFRGLNQGEFYIYSQASGDVDIDTIKVADGRFAYEVPVDGRKEFTIVFPNFSELPVYGGPGDVVKVKGDASHLREVEMTGTDDNKLLTDFRLNANKMSPPEVTEAAARFVAEHPKSPVSLYLIDRYFVRTHTADYARAYELVTLMRKADPENSRILALTKSLEALKASTVGGRLPDFAATDTDGKPVTRTNLRGRVNIVSAWATWNMDSQRMQRRLRVMEKTYGKDLAIVSVCLDARREDCVKWNGRDSITWPNVCDGLMWNTPMLQKVGIGTVPGNIIADRTGRIVARNVDSQQMEEQIKKLLK